LKILLTGSSGFLGQVIGQFLGKENCIETLGRNPTNDIQADLCLGINSLAGYDCVIHAAGKAHFVPRSEADKQAFWDVNVSGTRNLLMALEEHLPQRFVFISSVSVYGKSNGVLLNEQTPLLAKDPYGQSKVQAEAEVKEWCQSRGVICTILRLPLVYGKNPPGNLKTMIQGIKKGYYFNVAGGKARKSVVLADDIARFILPASELGGIYHLTDGYHPNFYELSHGISKSVGRNWVPNMPFYLARILAKIGDIVGPAFPLNSDKLQKITSELTFDDSLARAKFGWNPQTVLDYSTVTDFAKLRGLSTSKPRNTPM
jgi:nucleoside-diphosphate-sugar epimerase